MIVLPILILLACLCAAVVCPRLILKNPGTSRLYRRVTILSGVVVSGVAYGLTFHYSYFSNVNTRCHGWPVPIVIFQRAASGEPWMDYVGPSVILAFPMNLVLLLGAWFFLLWILNALIAGRRGKGSQQSHRPDGSCRR
jgi:hypothetical protein